MEQVIDAVDSGGARGAARWERARHLLLGLLTVEIVVLLATGVWLYFTYRPSASQAWGDVFSGDSGIQVARLVHRVVAYAAVPTTVAAGVVLASGPAARWRPRPAMVNALVMAALVTVAGVTGFLIAWDQLALWAVSVGTNADGFELLWGDDVRFVLMDGVEVSPDTIIRWLIVHVVVGVVLSGLVANAWRRRRISGAPPSDDRG